MLDVVEVVRRENVRVWRNVGWGTVGDPQPMGNWVALDLEQTGPNRDGVGAWIELRVGDRTWWREVTVGGGHAGGQMGPVHFGLGGADSAEVRVHWPDGEVGPWVDVELNNYQVLSRSAQSPAG